MMKSRLLGLMAVGLVTLGSAQLSACVYGHGYRRAVPRHHHGGSHGYWSHASKRGYKDGYRDGRDAARRARRYDLIREKRYRRADYGYQRKYGSRDAYRAAYRDGFRAGYSVGYRDGRRRW